MSDRSVTPCISRVLHITHTHTHSMSNSYPRALCSQTRGPSPKPRQPAHRPKQRHPGPWWRCLTRQTRESSRRRHRHVRIEPRRVAPILIGGQQACVLQICGCDPSQSGFGDGGRGGHGRGGGGGREWRCGCVLIAGGRSGSYPLHTGGNFALVLFSDSVDGQDRTHSIERTCACAARSLASHTASVSSAADTAPRALVAPRSSSDASC
jgi:hypothetical protein